MLTIKNPIHFLQQIRLKAIQSKHFLQFLSIKKHLILIGKNHLIKRNIRIKIISFQISI